MRSSTEAKRSRSATSARWRAGSFVRASYVFFAVLLMAATAHAHDPALDAPLPSLPEYFPLGIEHVLIGYDHLAFVLGLLLLARTRRALFASITAFTLAHSLSLSACVFGIVTPPSSWVEAAIALSIAYVAVAHRSSASGLQAVTVSLSFGFIHGFGFAAALEELGLPLQDTALALVLFNVGVEAGQLLALCFFAPALVWLRRRARGVLVLRYALFAFGVLLTASRGLQIVAENKDVSATTRPYNAAHAGDPGELVSTDSFRRAGARRD
jgi:hydrogenase/urease accessory protein HupE